MKMLGDPLLGPRRTPIDSAFRDAGFGGPRVVRRGGVLTLSGALPATDDAFALLEEIWPQVADQGPDPHVTAASNG